MKFDNWPKEALKRTLLRDYPGCNSALEAVRKVIQSKAIDKKVEVVKTDEIQKGADIERVIEPWENW